MISVGEAAQQVDHSTGAMTGTNKPTLVILPIAECGRENVGAKEGTTEIGLLCDSEGARDSDDTGKPTPEARKAAVHDPRSSYCAATPPELVLIALITVARNRPVGTVRLTVKLTSIGTERLGVELITKDSLT